MCSTPILHPFALKVDLLAASFFFSKKTSQDWKLCLIGNDSFGNQVKSLPLATVKTHWYLVLKWLFYGIYLPGWICVRHQSLPSPDGWAFKFHHQLYTCRPAFPKKQKCCTELLTFLKKKQIPMILATMNIDQGLLETPLIGIWTLEFLGWRWVKFSLKIDDFSRENWNLHHVLATGWFGLMGFHFKSQDGHLTFP